MASHGHSTWDDLNVPEVLNLHNYQVIHVHLLDPK